MSLLLLDRAQLRLKSEGRALALYEGGQRRGTVPLALVERCVIHGAATELDTGVLLRLADAGATTVLMSPRSPRRVALVLGAAHQDASVRLAQALQVLDDAACRRWGLAVVQAKTARQLRALQVLMAQRPDVRKPLFDAQRSLQAIAAQWPVAKATLPDSALPELASLRGIEGAAARAYFSALVAVMPPALGFAGRKRRPPTDPVNACLSLGYTLLHLQAVQAAHTHGLDPLLGFYHRPAFGRESLASDLIEPLRAQVDLWVWELLRSRTLREEHFHREGEACLLGKAGRALFYEGWEAAQRPWARWLRAQCRSLAARLRTAGAAHVLAVDDEGEPC